MLSTAAGIRRSRSGIDPDFAEQLFRVLLTETHRIEVAGQRPDAAPEKPATTGEARSGLDTVATRVDHIVVAVDDLDLAATTLETAVRVPRGADGRPAATRYPHARGRRRDPGAGRRRALRQTWPITSNATAPACSTSPSRCSMPASLVPAWPMPARRC